MSKRFKIKPSFISRMIVVALVVGVLGFGGVTFYNLFSVNNSLPVYMRKAITVNKEVGKTKLQVDRSQNWLIAAYYPSTSYKKINTDIKKMIAETIAETRQTSVELLKDKNNKTSASEVLIDFSSYVIDKHYASFVFTLITKDQLGESTKQIKTLVYDLTNETRITLAEVFTGNYLRKIAAETRKQLQTAEITADLKRKTAVLRTTAPTLTCYENFSFEGTNLVVYFNQGELNSTKATIAMNDLNFYLTAKLSFVKKDPMKLEETIYLERAADPTKKMIALTFDDGPNTPNTQRIVEILKANNAVATFFELGYRMEQNSSKMEMIINNDNQIGNHSFNHKIYTKITTAEMMDQIDSTNALMKQIVNTTATVVRPPNGSMNDSVRQNIGYPMILWNVDSKDWESRNKDAIVKAVLSNLDDGDIIVMHDIYSTSADAIEVLVPELIKQGYQLVTIQEMFDTKENPLIAGKAYYDGNVKGK